MEAQSTSLKYLKEIGLITRYIVNTQESKLSMKHQSAILLPAEMADFWRRPF